MAAILMVASEIWQLFVFKNIVAVIFFALTLLHNNLLLSK
jgi:ABC-type arginine transport system permease subunit